MFLFEFGLSLLKTRENCQEKGRRDLRLAQNLSAALFEEMLKMHCYLLS
jgi:hypothetical protein